MRLIVGSNSARGQDVGRIQVVRQRNNLFGQHVPGEDALFVAQLKVDSERKLMIIFVNDVAGNESSAGIKRFRKPGGNFECSRAQLAWINLVVDERRSQRNHATVLAGRRSKRRKVTVE